MHNSQRPESVTRPTSRSSRRRSNDNSRRTQAVDRNNVREVARSWAIHRYQSRTVNALDRPEHGRRRRLRSQQHQHCTVLPLTDSPIASQKAQLRR